MAAYDHEKVAHFIGGNSLEAAAPSSVKEFVLEHGGHTVITKVRASKRSAYEPLLNALGSRRF
jgi:hypothetical protein